MKRAGIIFLIIILLAAGLIGCGNSSSQLEEALADYSQMAEGALPDDLRLTIYYLDPSILTRAPLSAEDLMNFPETQKIIIDSGELTAHLALLQKMDPSILQPVKEESKINARLYYVFEAGDSGKILEVTISDIHGSAFVNGMEVDDHPVFYEIITPFLSEEAIDMLGI